MTKWREVERLLVVAFYCSVASLAACKEGIAHDRAGLCVIDPFMPPAFLGFAYWEQVGIGFAVVAAGVLIAAGMLVRHK